MYRNFYTAMRWTAWHISCSALEELTHWPEVKTLSSWRNLLITAVFRVCRNLSLSLFEEKTNIPVENLLAHYFPGLEPYFPTFLLPRLSPKSNQYVLDKVEDGLSADEYTLVRRLLSKDNDLHNIQVAAECKDHMAAGIDTTGDGLCFLMWELSQPHNRHVQERLHHEVKQVSADTSLEDLPYLDAVIKEALRLAPPIPMSFPRYVPKGGRIIDGYHIPEGTIVSCQPYSVHRLNEQAFPCPDTFCPERWLEPDGANDRNRLFFAFSTGARGCTGKK